MAKRKPFVVKKSNKQKVWQYLGRNRNFCIGEIACVFDMKILSVQNFIWTLKKIGYVKLVKKPTKSPKDWIYRCLKHTGLYSPSISGMSVFDHNTQESFSLVSTTKKETLYRTIMSIKKNPFSINDILKLSTKTSKRKIVLVLDVLRKKEVIVVDSVGKHGLHYFSIAQPYRNLIEKE